MKTLLLLLCMIIPLTGFSQKTKNVISENMLPLAAYDMLQSHYGQQTILNVKKEEGKNFEVLLTDSTNLKFDKKGKWYYIKNQKEGVNNDLIPVPIQQKIVEKFPKEKIKVTEFELHKNSYEVTLSNNQILGFDKSFNIKATGRVTIKTSKNGRIKINSRSYELIQ